MYNSLKYEYTIIGLVYDTNIHLQQVDMYYILLQPTTPMARHPQTHQPATHLISTHDRTQTASRLLSDGRNTLIRYRPLLPHRFVLCHGSAHL